MGVRVDGSRADSWKGGRAELLQNPPPVCREGVGAQEGVQGIGEGGGEEGGI